ncbi:LacI family DNA-binding transcriptional regulator [Epibacterium ulvae]|uniref:LacI family DNA-binding transcriptional regulator n=1 Tax=Epibacterium ulvae TaxID=1156985 RepID=UPI00248F5A0B|nr:LacI family DNA-binding transcriptional regulator [Epibacterium ulvae]
MSEKATTVQDVARTAGVSTATVSRALSTPDKVSERTREVVFKAVEQTGYRVNRAARNLRTQRSNTALVILPDLSNPFFSEILEGISDHLSGTGYSMLVAGMTQIRDSGERLIDYLNDGRADGMIVLDGSLPQDAISSLTAPTHRDKIVFACEWTNQADFPSVRSRNRQGARDAIRHLYDLGHRKIGHITGPEGNVLSLERRDGAVAELTGLGIAPRAEWVIPAGFSLPDGRKAAQSFLKLKDRPTAIFCASDIQAIALISELQRHDIRVPNDLSVVGFDDIEMAEFVTPALTTIRQDRFQLGYAAAVLLMECISKESSRDYAQIHQIPTNLVPRDSTAPLQP